MYFPRVIRPSLLPDFTPAFGWLFACGRPLTLSAPSPKMRIIQKNDRRSRALTPEDSITLSLGLDEEFRSRVDANPSSGTFLRAPSCHSWLKKLGTVRKCKLLPKSPQES